MMIIKKDGRLQEFDDKKLAVSIQNAAKTVSEMSLNSSDINMVVADVLKRINTIRKDNSNTSSYEVIGAIVDVLKRDGFKSVAREFLNFD